jgi:hypothetical protein
MYKALGLIPNPTHTRKVYIYICIWYICIHIYCTWNINGFCVYAWVPSSRLYPKFKTLLILSILDSTYHIWGTVLSISYFINLILTTLQDR